jgi:ferrous iron transport protein A
MALARGGGEADRSRPPLPRYDAGPTLEERLRIILSRAERFLNPTFMNSGPSSLEDLAVGGSAYVLDVAGDDAVAIRLLEMGLTPGVAVSVRGRAPFGDPIELELRGYRLSIRRAEAGRVTVETA